ncbi:MAG: SGNH/GDSL hydrolase family protein [Eubacteriales bacterium]|nr:SGNH/GDSL hydrolase family protein [Eubacteriales bacterium]MDD3880964.1 SGNH/GDSL hydrolase family protein [Eubacteriales bacterium]MDD4511967.1 SGNH/GDSL hydrolase family protein [Eubacteriales bacterium]
MEIDIRSAKSVRLLGRFDKAQDGFPMMWSGACAEMSVKAPCLEVEIECDYSSLRPYISFTVDGLRAQTFSPLKGKHWYPVYWMLDGQKAHDIRITLETQAFSADPASRAILCRLRFDGELLPLEERKMRLEFIGDSITSAEGCRGPQDFMEWVPMMFSASDSYPRYTADLLNADYQIVSQSGWGVMSSWDNVPEFNLPSVYDYICRPVAMNGEPNLGGEKEYDFAFSPDAVIINLGTNDANAIVQPPYTDSKTGKSYKRTAEPEALLEWENAAYAFIKHIAEKNPNARIIWAYGVCEDNMKSAVSSAVKRAQQDGVRASYIPLPQMGTIENGTGSRMHPGEGAHRVMAKMIAEELGKTAR